jgi:hypothetical protein
MKALEQLLWEEYLQKKNQLNDLKESRISCCKVYILWAESKIAELHEKLKDYEFESEQDEINFFKKVKPFIISKLIYEKEVLRIETNKPLGKAQKRKYFEEELKKISAYPQKDIKFYQYYRSDNKEFDSKYYTRASKKDIFETECFLVSSDPRLSTCYDYKVAKIKAFEELVKYLESQIIALKNKCLIQDDSQKLKLNWTGNKIDLIELVYALHLQKVFNGGNADIKEISSYIGKMFNTEIEENIYRSFLDLKTRKSGHTKFLDSLSESLNQKIACEEY